MHTQIYTENARSFLPKNFMCKYVCGLYGGGKGKTIIKKSYRGLKDMAVEILLFFTVETTVQVCTVFVRCFNGVSTMRKSYLDGVPTVRKNGCFDGEKKGISTVLEQ